MRRILPGRDRKQLEGHQLYYFSTCPYCIAVRAVLWWRGIRIPLKDIMFDAGNNADLIAGGGKGQVPCLRIEHENGSVEWMYESVDIIRYLQSEPGK
ncbi:MAG TPA: glutathione S-transferase N-terminal domain-containing protein [Gammaproteobacteria bacterium]|nr:glutathione S-transferase N-terminal domain-containing protein [Gammaproteobacteria bacterium]